ncbi:MAG: HPr family phosphocarrier protein [Bacillota bacterium]
MEMMEVALRSTMGFHARPASIFVKEAVKFSSEISIIREEKKINGKSIMGVLSLGLGCGDTFTIAAEGEDEKQAVTLLAKLVEDNFGE